MAELHVQKKEGSMWLWIAVGAVVLAMILWFVWRGGSEQDVGAVDRTDSTLVAAAPSAARMEMAAGTLAGSAVADYLLFVDARPSRAAGLAHEYTADGLRQLAAAISEITDGDSVGGVALQPRVDAIRERADAMQRNPNSADHALQVREAFVVASSLIEQMNGQPGSTTTDNLEALRGASTTIDPARPLLEQASHVEEFFAQAGEALRNITRTTR